jgi:hypothetical protein
LSAVSPSLPTARLRREAHQELARAYELQIERNS